MEKNKKLIAENMAKNNMSTKQLQEINNLENGIKNAKNPNEFRLLLHTINENINYDAKYGITVAKELYKKVIAKVTTPTFRDTNRFGLTDGGYNGGGVTCDVLTFLASSASDEHKINDKVWAREIYTMAESYAKTTYDFSTLASYVIEQQSLNDKEWGRLLFQNSEEAWYKSELTETHIWSLARDVADSYGLNDKDWARKILNESFNRMIKVKNEGSDNENEFIKLSNEIKEILEDVEFSNKVKNAKDKE